MQTIAFCSVLDAASSFVRDGTRPGNVSRVVMEILGLDASEVLDKGCELFVAL